MSQARRAAAARFLVVVAAVTAASCRGRSQDGDLQTGDDAGGPRACGAPGLTCAVDEYCAFAPGLCGKGKRPGTCRPRPAGCPDAYAPVCGCDGKSASSECAAHAAGLDLAVNGGCRAPIPGWIACGPRFCEARASYCELVLSDVFELPTDYTCKPLPAACVPEGDVARPCDCFPAGTRCRSFCGHLPTGGLEGFHLTCRL